MRKEALLTVFGMGFVLFFSVLSGAAMGIAPAKKEINFEANGVQEFDFTAYSDSDDKKIKLYAEGDLAKYTAFSRNELKGGGSFRVTISFPDDANKIEKPGKHKIYIVAEEAPPENAFIGTVAIVKAVIYVNVPYPGKYLEAELSVPDGNSGEMLPVEFKVMNRGKESLAMSSWINFADSAGNVVYEMNFGNFELEQNGEKLFQRYLNATGLKHGAYLANAFVDYGYRQAINKTFRIGGLFVNITNFTREIQKGGWNKFYVGVESMWNDNIPEVYADINISNSTFSLTLRTPPSDLAKWDAKNLEGFVDTSGLAGEYKSEIAISYVGQKNYASGALSIIEGSGTGMIVIIAVVAGGIAAIIIALVIAIKFIKKAGKKKR
jgi:hypothetical protein